MVCTYAPNLDLKGSALEVYNRRLDERLYRRAFVIENDLVEQKKVCSVQCLAFLLACLWCMYSLWSLA